MRKLSKMISITCYILFLVLGLCGCQNQNKENLEKVEEVIEMIDALPNDEEITIEDEVAILRARVFYNNLEHNLREKVFNLSKLEKLERELVMIRREALYQEHAQIVIALIEKLPSLELVTIDDEEEIVEARNAYDSIEGEAKIDVNNYAKLEALESKLAKLLKDKAYLDKALVVVDMIEALPIVDELTLADEKKVVEARDAYMVLNQDLKDKVYNLYLLTILEERIDELKNEAMYQKETDTVIQLIDELPSIHEVTLRDESRVNSVRRSYNMLVESFRDKVTNIDKLIALEEQIQYLKNEEAIQALVDEVIYLIDLLPNISELTMEDEDLVMNARIRYDALIEESKSRVINYQKLLESENKINEIRPYEVKYYNIEEGELDNVSQVQIPKYSLETKINYYTTGYWSKYSSEMFIFKTSLISPSEKYQYALKIGFNYNYTTTNYEVVQIVESSIALTEELRESEYYLFIHYDYTGMYDEAQKIEIGDTIIIDKVLPNEKTETLDASIKIISSKTEGLEKYFVAIYQGETALPIPQREGYIFLGWYDNKACVGDKITTIQGTKELFASWMQDVSLIEPANMLSCVSDIATSTTKDSLVSETAQATYEWSSSNSNVYVIQNGFGMVSKRYQTRKKQTVEVSVKITYKDGRSETKSKEIMIEPVLYDSLSSTPIATYFYSGGMSYFQEYNDRYKSDGQLFSNEAKKVLDIVYYAFAPIMEDGSIELENPEYIEEVLKLKENGIYVILCVDGVQSTTSKYFDDITADPARIDHLIKNIVDLVEKYNFDGIDIDWENTGTTTVKAGGMNALIKGLREELDSRTEEGGTPYFLGCAVLAGIWGNGVDRFDYGTLNKYVDYINLMSYNMNNNNKTTHGSPMYVSSHDGGYGFGCFHGANHLSDIGWPKSKLLIGGSGYGKGYKVTESSTNPQYPGLGVTGYISKIPDHPGSLNSGTVMGKATSDLLASGKYKKYIEYNDDGQLVGSYIYSEEDQYFVTYDSIEVVKAKYQYASTIRGMGLMWWCYQFDSNEFFPRALYEEIYG